jgi:hypothetical protein
LSGNQPPGKIVGKRNKVEESNKKKERPRLKRSGNTDRLMGDAFKGDPLRPSLPASKNKIPARRKMEPVEEPDPAGLEGELGEIDEIRSLDDLEIPDELSEVEDLPELEGLEEFPDLEELTPEDDGEFDDRDPDEPDDFEKMSGSVERFSRTHETSLHDLIDAELGGEEKTAEDEWEKKSGARLTSHHLRIFLTISLTGLLAAAILSRSCWAGQNRSSDSVTAGPESSVTPQRAGSESATQKAVALVDLFLKGTYEDRVGLLRFPEDAAEMKSHFREMKEKGVEWGYLEPGLVMTNAHYDPPHYVFVSLLSEDDPRALSVVWEGPEENWYDREPKIDWDSYIAKCPGWDSLNQGESETAVVRVLVRPVNYYNFQFDDAGKWQAFNLFNPDWPEGTLYGYVERGSPTEMALKASYEREGSGLIRPLTLEVSGRNESLKNRQVEITGFIAGTWTLPRDSESAD